MLIMEIPIFLMQTSTLQLWVHIYSTSPVTIRPSKRVEWQSHAIFIRFGVPVNESPRGFWFFVSGGIYTDLVLHNILQSILVK